MSDRLVTAGELAELLTVPVSWVREHTRNGHLPHIKLGRYRRYRLERALAWIDEQETGGQPWGKHKPRPKGEA